MFVNGILSKYLWTGDCQAYQEEVGYSGCPYESIYIEFYAMSRFYSNYGNCCISSETKQHQVDNSIIKNNKYATQSICSVLSIL